MRRALSFVLGLYGDGDPPIIVTNVTSPDPTPSEAVRVDTDGLKDGMKFAIPIRTTTRPGIDATLELSATAWS